MAYLYREVSRSRQVSMEAHLRACPECQSNLAGWQHAMEGLRQWRTPDRPPLLQVDFVPPAWRWALAALVVLGLGCAIGRFSAPATDVQAVRAAIEGPLRAAVVADVQRQLREDLAADWHAVLSTDPGVVRTDFQRELQASLAEWNATRTAAVQADNQRLLTDFWDTYRTERAEDRERVLTLFERADRQHQAEHAGLRRALETVAVVAADKFQWTETQLDELASYTQAKLALNQSDLPPFTPIAPSNPKGN